MFKEKNISEETVCNIAKTLGKHFVILSAINSDVCVHISFFANILDDLYTTCKEHENVIHAIVEGFYEKYNRLPQCTQTRFDPYLPIITKLKESVNSL